jgi:hypothetical protein
MTKEERQAYYQSHKAQFKEYQKRYKTQRYEYQIKYRYGITFEEFLEKVVDQEGKCKICEKSMTFGKGRHAACVDHNHGCCPGKRSCGKCIRGIICSSCNKLLGLSYDNISILKKAIVYLDGDQCLVKSD